MWRHNASDELKYTLHFPTARTEIILITWLLSLRWIAHLGLEQVISYVARFEE